MSTIHQIYCTHCTHRTSVFERHKTHLADESLGYSARAGSLKGDQLREYYHRVQPLVNNYQLPADTPDAKRRTGTAHDSPIRLTFSQLPGDMQVVGQVCYRAEDTKGRIGSYFGHLLFNDIEGAESRWSTLDCLRLWGYSKWHAVDDVGIPDDLLPQLDSLPAHAAPIGDDLLRAFVTERSIDRRHDPAEVIPETWRGRPPEERRRLLQHLLGGCLATGLPEKQLIVAAEPGFAALLFYAVMRLTPSTVIPRDLSFSTYLASCVNSPLTLIATTFHNPQQADFEPDVYRSGAFTLNTFRPLPATDAVPPDCVKYPRLILENLYRRGWGTVERILRHAELVAPQAWRQLELLADAHGTAIELVDSDPQTPPVVRQRLATKLEADYAQLEVGHALSKSRKLFSGKTGEADGSALAASPNCLLVIELLRRFPMDDNPWKIGKMLARRLPSPCLIELLDSPRYPLEYKQAAFSAFVIREKKLPHDSDYDIDLSSADGQDERAWLLADFFDQAKPRLLVAVWMASLAKQVAQPVEQAGLLRWERFLLHLLSYHPELAADDAVRIVGVLLKTPQGHGLCRFLCEHHDAGVKLVERCCESDHLDALQQRLHRWLDYLVSPKDEFASRLDALESITGALLEADQQRLAAWLVIRDQMLVLAGMASIKQPAGTAIRRWLPFTVRELPACVPPARDIVAQLKTVFPEQDLRPRVKRFFRWVHGGPVLRRGTAPISGLPAAAMDAIRDIAVFDRLADTESGQTAEPSSSTPPKLCFKAYENPCRSLVGTMPTVDCTVTNKLPQSLSIQAVIRVQYSSSIEERSIPSLDRTAGPRLQPARKRQNRLARSWKLYAIGIIVAAASAIYLPKLPPSIRSQIVPARSLPTFVFWGWCTAGAVASLWLAQFLFVAFGTTQIPSNLRWWERPWLIWSRRKKHALIDDIQAAEIDFFLRSIYVDGYIPLQHWPLSFQNREPALPPITREAAPRDRRSTKRHDSPGLLSGLKHWCSELVNNDNPAIGLRLSAESKFLKLLVDLEQSFSAVGGTAKEAPQTPPPPAATRHKGTKQPLNPMRQDQENGP